MCKNTGAQKIRKCQLVSVSKLLKDTLCKQRLWALLHSCAKPLKTKLCVAQNAGGGYKKIA